MAQQQQQQPQQLQAPTVVALRASFNNLAIGNLTHLVQDDILTDQDLLTLYTNMSNINGQDFHGFTIVQFYNVLAEFAMDCARIHANYKTNHRTNSAQGGGPRQVLYNRIRDRMNDQGLSTNTFIGTFATEVYNTMHRLGLEPTKWLKKGYKPEDKWVAFPGAHMIDPTRAQPPLTDGNLVALNANKAATIYNSQPVGGESHTTNHYFTGGILQTSSAHRPNRLLLTQG